MTNVAFLKFKRVNSKMKLLSQNLFFVVFLLCLPINASFSQEGDASLPEGDASSQKGDASASTLTESQQKGLDIAKIVKQRNTGWGSSSSNMVMILRNKKGKELERLMENKSLEVIGDGDKSLTIFNTPADVRGTAFLSFSHIEESDDQWIYLPALKRVKRIASRNKSGPFLGSEFAFEDLSSFEVEKNTYDYLGEEELNGETMFKVEMRPIDKFSGYTRSITWIDQEHYRIHKIDFYDRRDTLLKTLTIEDFKLYKDKFWRADKQFMVNHKTGKSTDIIINDLSFDVEINESSFNEKRLKNAR